jgi:hypothetical protein
MKRIIIKKLGHIAVVGLGIFAFSSCLKDQGPVQDFSQSPPVISFQGNGQGTNFSAISVLPTTTQSNPLVDSIGVSLGVSSLYLSKSVDVTVTADQAALDAYNSENSTNYTLLNSSAYVLANGGVWTVPAGKNLRYFSVSLIGANIDFTKSNALALKITNAPGTTIATNLNTYILLINLKSLFEDDYDISGTRTRYNGATVGSGVRDMFTISGTIHANTVSDSTIDCQAADAGLGANMSLQINSDNSVTVLPSILNPTTIFNFSNDGAASTYNPATKTFTLHYKYTTPNLRHIDEVMVGH